MTNNYEFEGDGLINAIIETFICIRAEQRISNYVWSEKMCMSKSEAEDMVKSIREGSAKAYNEIAAKKNDIIDILVEIRAEQMIANRVFAHKLCATDYQAQQLIEEISRDSVVMQNCIAECLFENHGKTPDLLNGDENLKKK